MVKDNPAWASLEAPRAGPLLQWHLQTFCLLFLFHLSHPFKGTALHSQDLSFLEQTFLSPCLSPDREVRALTSPLLCGGPVGLALVQTLQSPCRTMMVLINGKLALLNKVLFLWKARASWWKCKNMGRLYRGMTYMVLSQHPLPSGSG